MDKLIWATGFALLLFICGCATPQSEAVAAVMDADERMVEACEFVGQFQGSSGWGGLAASTGTENARNSARKKAARAGATHMVWVTVSGGMAPSVSGRGYACE